MRRRPALLAAALFAAGMRNAQALPPRPLQFPRDHGAHPDLRTEWWYITGHAAAGAREFGFQVTFFRSRVDSTQAMDSRFAARQLLFAHAAVTDVQGRKLWHDQRIARAGFGIAQASGLDTQLRLRDWTLERRGDAYLASIPAANRARGARLPSIRGVPPILSEGRPQGCAFLPRCDFALGQCRSLPPLKASGSDTDHLDRCWLTPEVKKQTLAHLQEEARR